MNEKRNHNNMMIEILNDLNIVEFDDVKNCANAKQMWDKLKLAHGRDANVVLELNLES